VSPARADGEVTIRLDVDEKGDGEVEGRVAQLGGDLTALGAGDERPAAGQRRASRSVLLGYQKIKKKLVRSIWNAESRSRRHE
jgi:hypothetical protein